MTTFVLRRILSGILLVGLLTFLTFFVFNEIPTNPACLVVACGPHTTTTDQMIKDADHRLGIDRSVFAQYGDWAWHLARHGDFGTSWTTQQHVGTMIGATLPVTASLVLGGMLLMLLIAIPLGSLAALRPRTAADRGLLALSVVGVAIHPFVLGLMLQDFSIRRLHILDFSYCPLTGRTATSTCGGPVQWAGHLAVPWLVFALLFLPLYMRMIRVRLLETFDEPWISTARAKGASEPRVVGHHALRNAMGPVLPMLAIDAGTAITAAIYVETVFGLGGLGSLAVQALSGQAGGYDLPLMVGIVFVIGMFVVLLNVAADIAGAWLDPRIRLRTASGLVPLPRAVASRPRVRLALNVAVAALLVALLAVAILNPGHPAAGTVRLAQPVRTVRVAWDDVQRVGANVFTPGAASVVYDHGYLELKTSHVEIGRSGWRVHATLTNVSPLTLHVAALAAPGTPVSYPNQPFSLLVQTDQGFGFKYLKPLPATAFVPRVPTTLKPHATWRGTFAGPDTVPKGALFYVGVGQFTYVSSNDPRPFSLSSAKSAHAP